MSHDQIREWSNDFLLGKLGPTLLKLACADSLWSALTLWFKHTAPTWAASSQSEFDSIASTRLTAEVRRRVAASVERNFGELLKAAESGVRKTVPYKLRSRKIEESLASKYVGAKDEDDHVFRHVEKSGVDEDARQDAWVRLLERGSSNVQAPGQQAAIAGMSSGRDATRSNLKYAPESQLNPNVDEDGTVFSPLESSVAHQNPDFEEAVWRLLNASTDANRKKLILDFWDANPGDMAFLLSYLARKGFRKRPASQKERNRANQLIARLRRLESKSEA